MSVDFNDAQIAHEAISNVLRSEVDHYRVSPLHYGDYPEGLHNTDFSNLRTFVGRIWLSRTSGKKVTASEEKTLPELIYPSPGYHIKDSQGGRSDITLGTIF